MPATLALELEKSARASVPVVPAIEGEPAPGFVDRPRHRRAGDRRGHRAGEPVRELTEATTEPVSI